MIEECAFQYSYCGIPVKDIEDYSALILISVSMFVRLCEKYYIGFIDYRFIDILHLYLYRHVNIHKME